MQTLGYTMERKAESTISSDRKTEPERQFPLVRGLGAIIISATVQNIR